MDSLIAKKSYIVLVGNIIQMPFLSSGKFGSFKIIVKKNVYRNDLGFECVEHYDVILSDQDAEKILKFGSCGMSIRIIGDFSLKNIIEITAIRIDFIAPPSTNQHELTDCCNNIGIKDINNEQHYLFDRNGYLRTEYTYLH